MKKLKSLAVLALLAYGLYSGVEIQNPQSDLGTGQSPTSQTPTRVSQTGLPVPQWDFTTYPNYYADLGFAEKPLGEVSLGLGEFYYSPLDPLGRTQDAYGIITLDTIDQSRGYRESFEPKSEPSGWFSYFNKNSGQRVSEQTYEISSRRGVDRVSNNGKAIGLVGGESKEIYFYNRSHLVADALGGRAFRQNLITGTRFQNVGNNDDKGGMRYVEKLVIDYIEANPTQSVIYYAKPHYEGEELVPRGVWVSAHSSDGSLSNLWYVFNTFEGYSINYETGEWHEN